MSVPSTTRQQMNDFFENLGYRLKLLEEIRVQNDVFLSSRFNVFDFIQPNENRLSDIIAALLDPKEAHGQADTFLREFLRILETPNQDLFTECCVRREDLTSHIESNLRRIDILVEFDASAIAIENKPWAGEQRNQIADYIAHLRRRFGENFTIVFLSPDGSGPEGLSEEDAKRLSKRKQLVCFSYRSGFRRWLEACTKECNSEKLRWFLRDFTTFVQREFGPIPYQP